MSIPWTKDRLARFRATMAAKKGKAAVEPIEDKPAKRRLKKGKKVCTAPGCGEIFKNNYRLYEHQRLTGHKSGAKKNMPPAMQQVACAFCPACGFELQRLIKVEAK